MERVRSSARRASSSRAWDGMGEGGRRQTERGGTAGRERDDGDAGVLGAEVLDRVPDLVGGGHPPAAGDHAHDHGNELSLEGMSDEEIREIQAALLAELESLQAAYDAIQAKLNGGEASE